MISPFPTAEDTLCRYAALLASRVIGYGTIRVYLSSVHQLQISKGLPDPRVGSMIKLSQVLKGIHSSSELQKYDYPLRHTYWPESRIIGRLMGLTMTKEWSGQQWCYASSVFFQIWQAMCTINGLLWHHETSLSCGRLGYNRRKREPIATANMPQAIKNWK